MFVFDFRNIIVLISLGIHALLLWILYRYGRKTAGGKAYAVAILAIAGWIFPMALYRSNLFGEMLLWARLLYTMASFTSTSFLFFTFSFPNEQKIPIWVQIALFVENIFIVFLCFHPTWMIQAVQIKQIGEAVIVFGPYYPVYVTHISLLFFLGFIELFIKMRVATGVVRSQIRSILIGYFIAANLAMTTNLMLPWQGYFELNWLGQFFSTLVAAFTTFAILKHRLLDIKLIATEGFILILNFFLFVQFLISQSWPQRVLNGVILISVFAVSYLLIRSIKKEVERREEVTKMAKSLQQANLKLQELDNQKTEFLSIAAHQLRTPLSVIKGYTSMIQEGDYGRVSNTLAPILDNVYNSNEHLIHLVDNFLDISRIEAGHTKYDFKPMNIKVIIADVVNELSARAKAKGLSIKINMADKLPDVVADCEKIRHVLYNFVDNAIKYSLKGEIEVTCEMGDKEIICTVSDTGIGIDEVDKANLFQKFYRGHNVQVVEVNGTGLGLFVCKKFIESHQGRIWVESKGVGKGSIFGFALSLNAKFLLEPESV